MSDSTHLGLTFVEAAQAQKHVTVNEALARIDALAQLAVKSRGLAAPPASPPEGARYLLGATPSGDWAGQGGKVAMFLQGQWQFASPVEGWRLWVDDEDKQLLFDGTSWTEAAAPVTLQNMQMVGVNATADATNRLSVAAAASLFNHTGAGHQIKLNKNAASDTATLLFQTGFAGRAEIGTAGDDKLHIKVSSDGTAFDEVLVADAATGEVRLPKGLTLPPRTAPAMPADGQMWHDSANASLKVQLGGTTHQIAPATPANLVTEFQLGTLALERVSAQLLGRKALVLDFAGGGFAHVDDVAVCELRSIVNIPGLTFANATGGKRMTRKRKFEMTGANILREQHGPDGMPLGVLFEAAHSYLNKQSQPTVAQLNVVANTADTAAPAGESGNWLSVTSIGTLQYAYETMTRTAGDIVWYSQEVIMSDGTVPVPSSSSTSGDFSAVLEGFPNAALNPDTGAPGYKIIGPLAGNKFIFQCYRVVVTTGASNWGFVKYPGQSAKNFKMGARNFGTGRYPTSMFDNATATPNSRAADKLEVPVSGFSSNMVTLVSEFVAPPPTASGRTLLHLGRGSVNDRIGIYFAGGSSIPTGYYNAAGVVRSNASLSAGLTPGQKYKMVAVWDTDLGRMRSKVTGHTAVDIALSGLGTANSPTSLEVGCGLGTDFVQTTISAVAIVDRAWTAAEIAAFTG